MKELLLHCGLHKTGSSAVQLWLKRNGALLSDKGIYLPEPLILADGNAPKLASRVLTLSDEEQKPQERKLRAEFVSLARQSGKDVIVSAEAFEFFFIHTIHRDMIGQMLGSRKAALSAYGSNVDVIRRTYRNLRAVAEEAGLGKVRLCFVLRNNADKLSTSYAYRVRQLTQPVTRTKPSSGVTGFAPYGLVFSILEEEGAVVTAGRVGQDPEGVAALTLRLLGLRERVGAADFNVGEVNSSIGEVGVVVGSRLRNQMAEHGLTADADLRRTLSRCLIAACAGIKDRPFHLFTERGFAVQQEGQARLNAQLGPWLEPSDIEALNTSRLTGPASPFLPEDLTDDQAGIAATIWTRLRAEISTAGLDLPFTPGFS